LEDPKTICEDVAGESDKVGELVVVVLEEPWTAETANELVNVSDAEVVVVLLLWKSWPEELVVVKVLELAGAMTRLVDSTELTELLETRGLSLVVELWKGKMKGVLVLELKLFGGMTTPPPSTLVVELLETGSTAFEVAEVVVVKLLTGPTTELWEIVEEVLAVVVGPLT
jgi:hypothetical protein